jgi:ATP-dependent Lon protease
MTEKTAPNKKDFNGKNVSEMMPQIEKKIDFFKDVIQKTVIYVQKNKFLDILGISDVCSCVEKLGELSKRLKELSDIKTNYDLIVNGLQSVNNELSALFKNFGTESLEDFLTICFGNNSKIAMNEEESSKYEILSKYFHPTSYKLVNIKKDDDHKFKSKQYHSESGSEQINLSCSDIVSSYKQFHMKVYGIKLNIYNAALKKNLLIFGYVDDIVMDFFNSKYVSNIKNNIKQNLPQEEDFNDESFNNYISSLIIKDYLIYNNEHEIYSKYAGSISQINNLKQKPISQAVKDFINDDMYNKRNTLINLLIRSSNYDNQYLAYLLYDLLSNDSNGTVDAHEQTVLFDSFPWSVKQYFKQAMKKTIQYTNDLSNFDINKIPLEQQICLLKASDTVKEKAMMKLKEVKAKSEDSGSKARQYLDGLLKIPFGVYKREPILDIMENSRNHFKEVCKKYNLYDNNNVPIKDKYTSMEVLNYVKKIQNNINNSNLLIQLDKIIDNILLGDKKMLSGCIIQINELLKKHNFKDMRVKYNIMNKEQLREEIEKFITFCKQDGNEELLKSTAELFVMLNPSSPINKSLKSDLSVIDDNMGRITSYMKDVRVSLDKAVYGHEKAKKQIERIIGQWLNGKQDGYCFGFEGPPGTGKTSLAKQGLSNCLKDDKGVSRPFSMIQMGGDSNGSTIHGHNYTYVGSTWGSIVQILIDKKCMNPIIFIDEVDKISRTENGKEIVGILTHLLDPAQNECFQDKYFTGIDIDLSKALFILSYNDASLIDKILLDRVHRIKFNSLSLEDKLVVSKNHILPEIYRKVGLEDMIEMSDDVLKYIIDEYTCEPGVRKLKEILFEIVAEINLDVLNNFDREYNLPIMITIEDVKKKYFKDKREVIIRKVPDESIIGYANGMYATSLGNGGTLPIHAKFFPSENFLELKLTGLQQDVMKESMHVALTVAWNLTPDNKKQELRKLYDGENNKCGINIHPGDAATSKDGPSAGGIITLVLYSLLNDAPIKARFAMTGEIQMSGHITAIGGLNHKIIGSLKAGVKEFIYPKENKKDFDEFYEKYKDDERLKDVKFYDVDHISEALELIIEK